MTIQDNANLKAVAEFTLPGGVVALNVFYFKADFADAQTDALVAAHMEIHVEAVYTEILASINDGVEAGSLFCYNRGVLNWDLFATRSMELTFTGVDDMLPQGVAALLRGYTTHPRVIGRKYLPGFTEGQQGDGVWGSGTLTALAAAGDAWAETQELSANNYIHGGVWSTVFATVMELTGTIVVPVNPGYQRRRRPGVGI